MLSFFGRAKVRHIFKYPLSATAAWRAVSSSKQELVKARQSNLVSPPDYDEWTFGPEESTNPHHFTSPRRSLSADGQPTGRESYGFEWSDHNVYPHVKWVKVNGKTHVWGDETKKFEQMFRIPHKNIPLKQTNVPFYPRHRLNIYSNHTWCMVSEWLFFWIPTGIVGLLAIPAVVLTYLQDEATNTTMTVKVLGRQWYWTYEVEAPTIEGE